MFNFQPKKIKTESFCKLRNESVKLTQVVFISSLVFANGPGDMGSIPGRVIPKTQKMVFDATLLNTQSYKVRIKGKV